MYALQLSFRFRFISEHTKQLFWTSRAYPLKPQYKYNPQQNMIAENTNINISPKQDTKIVMPTIRISPVAGRLGEGYIVCPLGIFTREIYTFLRAGHNQARFPERPEKAGRLMVKCQVTVEWPAYSVNRDHHTQVHSLPAISRAPHL